LRRLPSTSALALLWLAACADGLAPNPGGSLAGEPGLLPPVRQYYERRATEENGRCRAPLLDGVVTSTVVENTSQRMVIQIRYLYRDLTAELRGACRGFGNRTFTIDKEAAGFVVVDMTGAQHPRGLRLRLGS
jgi:hypothetical protein